LVNSAASLALSIKSQNLRLCGKLSHGLHDDCQLEEELIQLSARITIVLVSSINATGFQPIEWVSWRWYGYVAHTDPGAHKTLIPGQGQVSAITDF